MSFFIRAWVDGSNILAVNCNSGPITHDVVDLPGATVINAVAEGDYMTSEELRPTLTVIDGALGSTARTITTVT